MDKFVKNPVKIIQLSWKPGVKKLAKTNTYVFVGDVDSDVKTAIRDIADDKNIARASRILQREYGTKWRQSLGFPLIKTHVTGSAEYDMDRILAEFTTQSAIEPAKEELISDAIGNLITETTAKPIVSDKISDGKTFISPDETGIKYSRREDVEYVASAEFAMPEDTIMDLKLKLFVASHVSIFRQHLFYITDGQTKPLGYAVKSDVGFVNIGNAVMSETHVGRVPVDNTLYNVKNYVSIQARDRLDILLNIYERADATNRNVFYFVDLYDFVGDTRALAENIADTYQFDMLYHGFIKIYWPMLTIDSFKTLMTERDVFDKRYPDLAPSLARIRARNAEERKIVRIDLPDENSAFWRGVRVAITHATAHVANLAVKLHDVRINLRNLFDYFRVYENEIGAIYIKANLQIGSNTYVISKTLNTNPVSSSTPPFNTIMIALKSPHKHDTRPYIVTINDDGAYVVDVPFRREMGFDFADCTAHIVDVVTPLIRYINELPAVSNRALIAPNKDNIRFSRVNVVYTLETTVNEQRYEKIREIISRFTNAGIFEKTTDETNLRAKDNESFAYFAKGIHQFNIVNIENIQQTLNQYTYLTDLAAKTRWQSVFPPGRVVSFQRFYNEFVVNISDVMEQEYDIVSHYIYALFTEINRTRVETSTRSETNRKLALLKQTDPELYEYRKFYGDDASAIYSKKCQKPKQPIIYSLDTLRNVPKSRQSRIFKYWNFTRKEPAFYECPNPKYPHISYITGIHPKNYCVPCCKKSAVRIDNTNPTRYNMHQECAEKYTYSFSSRVTTREEKLYGYLKKGELSRYIVAYGKPTTAGRLMSLPDALKNGLFAAEPTHSTLYVVGVSQYLQTGAENAAMSIVATAIRNNAAFTKKPLSETEAIRYMCARIHDVKYVRTVINASYNVFETGAEMSKAITETFINKSETNYREIEWNRLIFDIARYLLGFHIYVFDDVGDTMQLRGYSQQHLTKTTPIIVAIDTRAGLYPIYRLNVDEYFASRTVITTLFNSADSVVEAILEMADETLETLGFVGVWIADIAEFCENSDYVIIRQFLNAQNQCYAVLVSAEKSKKSQKSQPIYVPINFSEPILNIAKTYEPFVLKKYAGNFAEVLQFIERYNDKTARNLRVTHALKYADMYVGFEAVNMNWYVSATKTAPKNIANLPVKTFRYHPDEINSALTAVGTRTANAADALDAATGDALYRRYLYQLMFLELMNYFGNKRNSELRRRILSVGKYAENKGYLLTNVVSEMRDELSYNDRIRLRLQLSELGTMKKFEQEFANYVYEFDRAEFYALSELPVEKIREKIRAIFEKITVFGVPKITQFSNIVSACYETSNAYCSHGKLVVLREKFDDYVDIIARNISEKWRAERLFAMTNAVIDPLLFTKRPYEKIEIELI